ncbi:MAG: FecCD family ABC transporter permease [Desulfatirhabdiaceae bacterium]
MARPHRLLVRMAAVSAILVFFLVITLVFGLSLGATQQGFGVIIRTMMGQNASDPMLTAIIWHIRLPRVLLATLTGATLSAGGLVFQALLRNPLAEPYILGISGGSAIGAIIGIILGFSRFPGVTLMAFFGSMVTLVLVMIISTGRSLLKKDSLLLAGVMVNAFCSAVIMFLISMTQDARLHNIIFWLMGDLSMTDLQQVGTMAVILIPGFILIFCLSHALNLMLMGREMAMSAGLQIKTITIILLVTTSLMVSTTVSHCGLIGFVGLVIPHLLRMALGPDHRVLIPASILGGGAYMVFCDLLARTLPRNGEMPAGVITALIGAPIFIVLLKRSNR